MVSIGIVIENKYNIEIRKKEVIIMIIIGTIIGIYKNYIKRIISISTMTNIGMIIINKQIIGFIHSRNHGIIKNIIFIISGKIIHSLYNQDMIKLKGSI